jgi:hypothetical protein
MSTRRRGDFHDRPVVAARRGPLEHRSRGTARWRPRGEHLAVLAPVLVALVVPVAAKAIGRASEAPGRQPVVEAAGGSSSQELVYIRHTLASMNRSSRRAVRGCLA